MKQKITATTSIANIQKSMQSLWKIFSKKKRLVALFYALVGSALIAYGLEDRFIIKTESSNNAILNYELNIFISIGLAFIIVFIINIYSLFSEKKDFFRKVDKSIHDLKDFNYTYEISENGIEYSNSVIKMYIIWSKFSDYYLMPEFLYLFINNESSPLMIISKSELSEKDFVNILGFVKKNIPEYKP